MPMLKTSALDALLHERIRAVTRRLAAARGGGMEAVHRARVATRRLRETLPLVASGAPQRKLERTVRRLTRALGPVRELDVSLALLDELQAAGRAPAGAIDLVRQSIAGERGVAQSRAVKHIDRWNARRVRKRAMAALEAARSANEGATARPAHRVPGARSRAGRRAERLREAVERAAGLYMPERLHDVRIAVKKLRYALEIVEQSVPRARAARASASRSLRSTAGQIAQLARTQELLGRMHDLDVLASRTRGVQGARGLDPSIPAALDALVRGLETECRQLHGHYMGSRDRLLEICARVTAAARPARSRRPVAGAHSDVA